VAVVMGPPMAPLDAHAKAEISELKAQLLEEQAKHKQAKQALLSEQQYFANEISHLEELTKGAVRLHVLQTVFGTILSLTLSTHTHELAALLSDWVRYLRAGPSCWDWRRRLLMWLPFVAFVGSHLLH
jgi:hypothetical protein